MVWKISQGAQDSSSDLPLNALGSALSVEQATPVAQLAFDSGASEKAFLYSTGGGSTSVAGTAVATCTNAAESKAQVLTKRFAVNRPGAGIECRIEARFDSPVLGTRQLAGMIGATDELGFGYDTNGNFGIFRNHSGATHIHQFAITSGASGGSCTVTLDDTGIVTTLAAGLTADEVASELARLVNAQTQDWVLYSDGTNLYAVSYNAYAPAGAFSISGAGVTAVTAVTQTGVAPTEVFWQQTAWNQRPDIEVTPGNLTPYRIACQFSGGAIVFQVADRYTGVMQTVHVIQFPGTQIAPIVKNPHFRAGISAENLSGAAGVTARSTSMQLAIQGKNIFDGPSRVAVRTTTDVPLVATNLLTVKNGPVVADRSHAEVLLKSAVATSAAEVASTVYAIKNAVFTDPLIWSAFSLADSQILLATNAVGVDISGGEIIDAISFIDDSPIMNLAEMSQYLAPGETLTLAGLINSGTSEDMSATLKWFEDY